MENLILEYKNNSALSSLENKIIKNIGQVIKEEEFYKLEADQMKNILMKTSFNNIKDVQELVHNIVHKCKENNLFLIKYIECGKVGPVVFDVIKELGDIPIIREALGSLRSEGKSSDIAVDWEKQYYDEEKKRKDIEAKFNEIKSKYDSMHSTAKKNAPKKREYPKKEIKKMFELFEQQNFQEALHKLIKDPSLIYIKDADEDNSNLIIKAAENNWEKGINLILSYGLFVDGIVDTTDDFGRTPLIVACRNGATESANTLYLKGANINHKDMAGDTPLSWASCCGHLDIVKLLLAKGANQNIRDYLGNTPLMRASYTGKIEVVKFLLSRGFELEAKNKYGETALMIACHWGYQDVAEFLALKGGDIEAKDNTGRTPLMWASEGGHAKIVEFLLSRGAKFDLMNDDGKTALDIAEKFNRVDVVRILKSKEEGK